jgi:hypothetical protein
LVVIYLIYKLIGCNSILYYETEGVINNRLNLNNVPRDVLISVVLISVMTDTNIFRYALSSIIKEHFHKIRDVSDNIPHASLPPAFPVLRLSSCPPIRKEQKKWNIMN